MKAYFITFEGIEGSGKTTQMELISRTLRARVIPHITTREPGGTPIGEGIRKILLDPANGNMKHGTELLLYSAARVQHVAQIILPALRDGRHVLCDRYKDATEAYQGGGRNIPLPLIRSVDITEREPDRTILLDMNPREALERARERNRVSDTAGAEGRFEEEALAFHTRVRERYNRIAEAHPDRITRIEATGSVEMIQQRIREALADLFPADLAGP